MKSNNHNKVPRYLSAARASIHTLSCAGNYDKQVPSGEEMFQIIMNQGDIGLKDKTLIPRLWSLIRILIASHVDDWRHSLRSPHENYKTSFNLSESIIGNMTTMNEIKTKLFQLGYRRYQFYGWGKTSSLSLRVSQNALCKELLYAVSWLIALNDGFGLAREIAWSKFIHHNHHKHLPPWQGDISVEEYLHPKNVNKENKKIRGEDSDIQQEMGILADNELNEKEYLTVSDACNGCLLTYGNITHLLKKLKVLSTSRVKILTKIDKEQHRVHALLNSDKSIGKESRQSNLTTRSNKSNNQVNKQQKQRQEQQEQQHKVKHNVPFLSAKQMYILKSPSRFKEVMVNIQKGCEFAERLKESSQLESSFWKLLLSSMDKDDNDLENDKIKKRSQHADNDDEVALSAYESAGIAYEKLRRKIKKNENVFQELEDLYEEVCFNSKGLENGEGTDDDGLSREVRDRLERQVDADLEKLYQPLFHIMHKKHQYAKQQHPASQPPPSVSTTMFNTSPPPIPSIKLTPSSTISSNNNKNCSNERETLEDREALDRLLRNKPRQEQTQMAVLQGALKLIEPHLFKLKQVKPIKFETVRERKRREAKSMNNVRGDRRSGSGKGKGGVDVDSDDTIGGGSSRGGGISSSGGGRGGGGDNEDGEDKIRQKVGKGGGKAKGGESRGDGGGYY